MLNPKLELSDKVLSEKPELIATRDGYGKGLVELGETNPDVVVLTGDLKESTRAIWFEEKYPDRFFEVGVAEQNMMGIAAGLALSGKIPFISSYAVFSPGRSWDQLRVSVCYSEANVKVAGAHTGISVGPDGATHQALEDIAITRVLPNLKVIAPCDFWETKKATIAAAKIKGPVYFRFARELTPVITTEKTPFEIGKAEIFWQSNSPEVTIIAAGPLVYEALLACQKLKKAGIETELINSPTIKLLDEKTILEAVKKSKAVVTVEEHQIIGGLGGAVAEFLSEKMPIPLQKVGIADKFGESGAPDELLEKYGLKSDSIIQAVKLVLKRKPFIKSRVN